MRLLERLLVHGTADSADMTASLLQRNVIEAHSLARFLEVVCAAKLVPECVRQEQCSDRIDMLTDLDFTLWAAEHLCGFAVKEFSAGRVGAGELDVM
jgi:hypothetical protein